MYKRLSDLTVEEALNIIRKGCAVLYFKKLESGRIISDASFGGSIWYYLEPGGFTLHCCYRRIFVGMDNIHTLNFIYLCDKDKVDEVFHELNSL